MGTLYSCVIKETEITLAGMVGGDTFKSPKCRALVLGGGFIGSNVACRLHDTGAHVRVLTRTLPADLPARVHGHPQVIVGDASVRSELSELMPSTTHVIFAINSLMPGESDRDPQRDMHLMLSTLITTLDVLADHRDITLVLVSSGGTVYGRPELVPTPESAPTEPISAYGITRLTAEKFAQRHAMLHGAPVRIARVANVYGPGQTARRGQGFIAAALDHASAGTTMTLFGDGAVRRDFIHIADAARHLADYTLAAEAPSVMNIGSGRSASMSEVADIVRRVTARPLRLEHTAARPFDVPEVQLDVSLMTSLFPGESMPLEEGIAETWEDRQRMAGRLDAADVAS